MDLTTGQAPTHTKTSLPPSLQGDTWTWEQKDGGQLWAGTGRRCAKQSSPFTFTSTVWTPPSCGCRATPKEWPHVSGGTFLRCQMNLLPDLSISLQISIISHPCLALLSPAPLLYLFQFPSVPFWTLNSILSFGCHWSPSVSLFPTTQ